MAVYRQQRAKRVLKAGEVIEVGTLPVSICREVQSRHGVNYQDAIMKRAGSTLPARADSSFVGRADESGGQQEPDDETTTESRDTTESASKPERAGVVGQFQRETAGSCSPPAVSSGRTEDPKLQFPKSVKKRWQ